MSDKPFRPMKGDDIDVTQQGHLLRFPYMASPKVDGLRCVIRNGVAMTSSMKPHVNRHVQALFGRPELEGLDGELVVGPPNASNVFERSTSELRRIEGEPDVTFWVFDCVLEWPAHARYLHACRAITDHMDHLPVRALPMWMIHHGSDLSLCIESCLNAGYEGAMLRQPDSPYKQGRATLRENYLLKVKPMADHEAVVIGFTEQMANTNEKVTDERGLSKRSSAKAGKVGKGTLGTLVVRGINGPYAGVEFEVGTGFTDSQRLGIWQERDDHLGLYITYRYQPVGNYQKPRLPVFKAFRDFDGSAFE